MVDALGNAPSEPKGKRFTVFPVSLTEYASIDWSRCRAPPSVLLLPGQAFF